MFVSYRSTVCTAYSKRLLSKKLIKREIFGVLSTGGQQILTNYVTTLIIDSISSHLNAVDKYFGYEVARYAYWTFQRGSTDERFKITFLPLSPVCNYRYLFGTAYCVAIDAILYIDQQQIWKNLKSVTLVCSWVRSFLKILMATHGFYVPRWRTLTCWNILFIRLFTSYHFFTPTLSFQMMKCTSKLDELELVRRVNDEVNRRRNDGKGKQWHFASPVTAISSVLNQWGTWWGVMQVNLVSKNIFNIHNVQLQLNPCKL